MNSKSIGSGFKSLCPCYIIKPLVAASAHIRKSTCLGGCSFYIIL